MDTKALWVGEFGNEYTARNRVDWRKRVPFWSKILILTGARSVFEFGCNAGWNLSAIQMAANCLGDWMPKVYGMDLNVEATAQAQAAGLNVWPAVGMPGKGLGCELAFTAGVLIHIPPEELSYQMDMLIHQSTHFVLAVEYEAQAEEVVPYRGQEAALWKRPYGKLYREKGLNLVAYGDSAEGFDRCAYWLFRK